MLDQSALDQSATRPATPVEVRDERSMKVVELALSLTALFTAIVLAFTR